MDNDMSKEIISEASRGQQDKKGAMAGEEKPRKKTQRKLPWRMHHPLN